MFTTYQVNKGSNKAAAVDEGHVLLYFQLRHFKMSFRCNLIGQHCY